MPRGAALHRLRPQRSVAVRGALAEASGPPIDVLDAHGFELVRTRVTSLTVVHGVDHLVEQRCHGVAHDRASRIAVAAALELRAQRGVPDDRSRLVRVVRLQQVAPGDPIGADLVAGVGAVLEPLDDREHLGRLSTGIDAASKPIERIGDLSRVRRLMAGHERRLRTGRCQEDRHRERASAR